MPTSAPTAIAAWLVIGAGGFIGQALGALLTERGTPWVGTRRRGVDTTRDEIVGLALEDPAAIGALLDRVQPTVVVHAAGHPPGIDDAGLRATYVEGTRNLLGAIDQHAPTARVVVVGSAAVYGNAPRGRGSREDDPHRPLTAYGRAKAAQEAVVAQGTNRDVVIARVFNPIGPGQGPHLLGGALLARLAAGERPLRVRAVDHLREWIDVRDVARALVLLGTTPTPPAVVNICAGRPETVGAVATALVGLSGGLLASEPGPTGDAVLSRSVGDAGRLRALGWGPRYDLATSLRDQWQAAGSPRQTV